MPPVRISRYGTVRGGVADKAHRSRAEREAGALWYIDYLERNGCISTKHGWCRITRIPRLGWRKIAKLGKGRAEWQNGVFRMDQDVIDQLYATQRAFRFNQLEVWAKAIAAFEFGLASPKGQLFPIIGKYEDPHAPAIYEDKKADGVL